MRPFFTHCIFCRRDLASPGASSKEHIVPELLYGSIPTLGVCQTCNSELGSQVDILGLRDPFVAKAAFHLDLPELQGRIRDEKHNRTYFRDKKDGHEIPGRSKGGAPRIQPWRREPDLFEGPLDHMWDEKIPKEIRKYGERYGIPKEDIEKVQQRVREDLSKMKPGDSLWVPETDFLLTRQEAEPWHEIRPRYEAIRRLVAKMAFETAALALDPESARALTAPLVHLRDLARHGTEPPHPLIFTAPWLTEKGYPADKADYHHHLLVEWTETRVWMQVTLFGNVTYFADLSFPGQTRANLPTVNGVTYDGTGLLMFFCPGKPREKLILSRVAGCEEWIGNADPEL